MCVATLLLQLKNTRFAAWMNGVAKFDEEVFRLSAAEAMGLDPQCRILLECVWVALQVRVYSCNSNHNTWAI